MTSLSKDTIKSKVRLLLNELAVNDSQFDTDNDEVDLNSIIEGLAEEALKFVNLNADNALLEYDNFKRLESNAQVVELAYSDEFLRFVEAVGKEWAKPVRSVVTPDDPRWATMSDAYIGGTNEYPLVGMERSAIAESVTTKSGITNTSAEYAFGFYPKPTAGYICFMVIPSFDSSSQLHVSPLLEEAFYYYLTGMVLSVLNDAGAQSAFNQAMVLMGRDPKQAEQ